MNLHAKVSGTVARWNRDLIVNPAITDERWQALRRPVRVRATLGVLLAAGLLAFAVVQLAGDAESLLGRVCAFLALIVAAVVLVLTVVRVSASRTLLALTAPELFGSRRAIRERGVAVAHPDASEWDLVLLSRVPLRRVEVEPDAVPPGL